MSDARKDYEKLVNLKQTARKYDSINGNKTLKKHYIIDISITENHVACVTKDGLVLIWGEIIIGTQGLRTSLRGRRRGFEWCAVCVPRTSTQTRVRASGICSRARTTHKCASRW